MQKSKDEELNDKTLKQQENAYHVDIQIPIS